MENIILSLSIVSVVLLVIVLFLSLRRGRGNGGGFKDSLDDSLNRNEKAIREESERGRKQIEEIKEKIEQNDKENKEILSNIKESVTEKLNNESNLRLKDTISLQTQLNDNFDKIRLENREAFKETTREVEKLTLSVNDRLNEIKNSNEAKLKEIQGTVDQKLQEALDKNITKAFDEVQKTLVELHKSVGSLDSLKSNVQEMNKIFSNTKSRGYWGEKQAENILQDILIENTQWVRNYHPEGKKDVVEFAIKMPGKNGDVYLPVDSKFSITSYENYKTAIENNNQSDAENALKTLKSEVKKEAKTIHDKYIFPPETTDFGIMFIPSEGLYLEIVKMDGVIDEIQNEYRVVVTGPGNFAAMLNALSLGFKTLQIEKYTSRIWSLFENIKKLFGDLSKKIDDSKKDVDKAQTSLSEAQSKKNAISDKLLEIESDGKSVSLDDSSLLDS